MHPETKMTSSPIMGASPRSSKHSHRRRHNRRLSNCVNVQQEVIDNRSNCTEKPEHYPSHILSSLRSVVPSCEDVAVSKCHQCSSHKSSNINNGHIRETGDPSSKHRCFGATISIDQKWFPVSSFSSTQLCSFCNGSENCLASNNQVGLVQRLYNNASQRLRLSRSSRSESNLCCQASDSRGNGSFSYNVIEKLEKSLNMVLWSLKYPFTDGLRRSILTNSSSCREQREPNCSSVALKPDESLAHSDRLQGDREIINPFPKNQMSDRSTVIVHPCANNSVLSNKTDSKDSRQKLPIAKAQNFVEPSPCREGSSSPRNTGAAKWGPSVLRRTPWFSFWMSLPFFLVLIAASLPNLAEGCSSRSTPRPRPLSPTLRPNITFQTYACPPAYAAWYCLNGATCFTVKIAESILYNCECADGYMGQRCEYKDLDGSYLPTGDKVLLETASIAGGAALVIILVFFGIFSAFALKNKRSQHK
ncbi:uncharacterized protein LOC108669440 [Hyalella azteca]|uniref:Uncharacterized protein LOC108669440 n=1 Tax=Hyalella azteca TaxID=294128 RepID=A0A8B7NFN8_HYAAZ|nr:uncharacterized protein LOC108669440 [Hyalella azteca]